MTDKFYNVKIDQLTDAECRELLKIVENLVSDFPSFIIYDRDAGFGRGFDDYSCCDSSCQHAEDCPVQKLNQIFGYR